MAAHDPTTKTKIAEAAIRLILDHGFAAATAERIRAAAGASNGSFYASFGSRDKLHKHLLDRIKASHKPVLVAALSVAARSPLATLRAILRAHLQWTLESPTLARLRTILTHGLAAEGPADHARAIQWEVDLVASWGRPLMANGAIRQMPESVMHALVMDNTDTVARHWKPEGSADSGDALALTLADAAWVALGGRRKQANGQIADKPAIARLGRARTASPPGGPRMPDLFLDSAPPKT